jgi:hypothetical protein
MMGVPELEQIEEKKVRFESVQEYAFHLWRDPI